MDQSNNRVGLPALQRLTHTQVQACLEEESALLAATWFEYEDHPSSLVSTFALALARALLVLLAARSEETWLEMNQKARVGPYRLCLEKHRELLLLMEAPERGVFVRLRPLAMVLLQQETRARRLDLAAVLKDAPQEGDTKPTPKEVAATIRLAHHVSVQLTASWSVEVARMLAHPDVDVLPAPTPRQIN